MASTDDDGSDGLMGWIGDALETPGFLKTRMIFGIVVGLAATWLFTHILLQMERQTTTYNAALMEAAVGERDTQLELEEDTKSSAQETSQQQHQHNGDYVQASDDNDDDMTINSHSPSNSPKSVMSSSKMSFGDAIYKPGDTRRRLLSSQQRVQIIVHVLIVVMFNFLLLVYLPGSIWLSFVAVVTVWILALQSYLRDELRRRRYDRILTLISLFSIIAGSLTLITFCHLSLNEGNIYEGPARIVGYDSSSYGNSDGTTMRADLQVSWGGMWGCPDEGGKECMATVQGALCETKYDVAGVGDNNNNNRRRRRRVDQSSVEEEVQEYQDEQERDNEEQLDTDMNETANEELNEAGETMTPVQEEVVDEVFDESLNETVEEIQDESDEEMDEVDSVLDEEDEEVEELSDELNTEEDIHEQAEGELEDEVTVLESNSTNAVVEEELSDMAIGEAYEAGSSEGAANELEDKNEELQDALDNEEELVGELDEEIEDLEDGSVQTYSYDDAIFEDDYWQQDWSGVWGEYACEDLFDGDLDGLESMDMNLAPGTDQWPTVNIYGSCTSCTAYILDYYSTEHFQNIRSYEYQSWLYFIMGFFLMVIAAAATLIERVRPTKDKEIVLLSLSHEGGVPA
jgi:hypothetical protein